MLKQFLQYKLSQKLSPQQIQLMKLIELPTQAFEQRLKQELEENPALESGKEQEDNYEDEFQTNDMDGQEISAEDINLDDYLSDDEIPEYRLNTNNHSVDDEQKTMPFASGSSFTQLLINQLNTFSLDKDQYKIAEFLIGSIDDSGYIRRPLLDIMDDLAFTQNFFTDEKTIESALKIVHQLDPAGVGARNLQECLALQLLRKTQTANTSLAKDIINSGFDQFTKKHYQKLIQKFDVTELQLRDAVLEIERLNPKPGSSFSNNTRSIEHVVPDFTISIVEGELELTLNGRNAPELHVSQPYNEMLKGYKASKEKTKSQKEAVLFIKQKLDAAKWFIDAIEQRHQTLYLTINAIVDYQSAYFLTGDEQKLKPMILKDIADKIDMDISTISRVANSKYIDTPYGVKLLKSLFSEGMKNDEGEDVSTIEIKNILDKLISNENKKKPLADQALSAMLKEKGYKVARRTVAKYREQMDIPVARLRKSI